MKYKVGDLLRYKTDSTISKKVMYCVVLEAGIDSGVVFWLHGSDKQFQQTVAWKSYYGTYERAS